MKLHYHAFPFPQSLKTLLRSTIHKLTPRWAALPSRIRRPTAFFSIRLNSSLPLTPFLSKPLTLLLGICLLAPIVQAQNTTNSYTGTSGGSVTTGSNWSLNHVPTVSEDAVFNSSVAGGIRTIGADLTVGSFNVTATSGVYSIRNETSTASDRTLTLGGASDLGNGVSGTAADLLYVATGATFALRGDNPNGAGVLKLALGQDGNFDAAGTLDVSAGVSGNFNVTKTGTGSLTLSGNNTFGSGKTFTLSSGTLNINSATALGAGTFQINGGTTINSTAAFTNQTLTNNNALTMNGDFTFTGTNSLNLGMGNVSLGTTVGTSRTIIVSANTLTIGGQISNGTTANSITKSGAGTLVLSAANSYTGGTALTQGTLAIGSDNALGSGPFTISNSPTIQSVDSTAHTITNMLGTLSGSGVNLTFGATSGGTGNLLFTQSLNLGSGTRILTVNNTTTFSGGTSGSASLTKQGGGTLILGGTGSYTGATAINAGTLLINNANSSSGVTVNGSGSTLGGIGTISGAVTVGSTAAGAVLNPGPKGTNSTSASVGTLTTGALTLSSNANTFHVDAFGTAANQWDKLVSTGAITLGGGSSTLDVTITGGLSFTPGAVYVLVNGTSLVGIFNGIVDNQTVSFSGYDFTADYTSTGFDLVAVPEPSSWLVGALAVITIGWSFFRKSEVKNSKLVNC